LFWFLLVFWLMFAINLLLCAGLVRLGVQHVTVVLPATRLAVVCCWDTRLRSSCNTSILPPFCAALLLLLQGEEESDEDEADREAAAAGAASGVLERYSGVKVGAACWLIYSTVRGCHGVHAAEADVHD
jgi:hypothetical protein